MPIFDHFGILAPVYDRFIGRRIPDRLLQLLNLPVSGRLLDAAGGTGRIAQLLESKTGGVVVADESSGMLVQARQKGCCSLARSHIEHLPFSDGSFERVIMVDALHHVADQPGSVRELWRVLAPGGVMVIEEMNLHKLSVKMLALAEKLMLMRSHLLYPEEIEKMLAQEGAKLRIVTEYWTFWVVAEKENPRKRE